MTLSTKVVANLPCPECRKEGRDKAGNNLAVYADGHGKCWSGHGFFPYKILRDILENNNTPRDNTLRDRLNPRELLEMESVPSSSSPPIQGSPTPSSAGPPSHAYDDLSYRDWRGVTAETMKFFDVKSNDEVIIFPWGPEASLIRRKDRKDFFWTGKARESQGLFGMDKFVSGSGFVVSIFEGALDAMMGWQLLGGKYACVAVKSAATALTDCTKEFDWLNGFDKIKLALDWDKPGQEAAAQVARLFDVNKIYWMRP